MLNNINPNAFVNAPIPIDQNAFQNALANVRAAPSAALSQLGAGGNVNPNANPFGFLSNVFAGDLAQRQAQQAAQSQAQLGIQAATALRSQKVQDTATKQNNALAIDSAKAERKQKIVDAKAKKKDKIRIARITQIAKQLHIDPASISNLEPSDIKIFTKTQSDTKKGKTVKPLSVSNSDIKAIANTLSADKTYTEAISQIGDASGTIDAKIASDAARIQHENAVKGIPISRVDATIQAWNNIKQTPGFFKPGVQKSLFGLDFLAPDTPPSVDPQVLLGDLPIKTPEEARKLPKGTKFRSPDGRRFTR